MTEQIQVQREEEVVFKSDPNLVKKLKKLGATGIDTCFNCGTCTATCPLSTDGSSFPRKMITYAQLGLEKKILQNADPWLCYYCGECSKTCPRQAEPAETMMAMRRYLTTRYDWTGVSNKLYTSKFAKYVFVLTLALFTTLLVWLFHGPIIYNSVDLLSFAPLDILNPGGIVVGVLLGAFLISNLARMYWHTVRKDGTSNQKIPLTRYVSEFKSVVVQFFTQQRYSGCLNRRAWANHLVLMWGYVVLFVLYAVLLPMAEVNSWAPISDPIRLAGYFGFIALTYGVLYAIVGRITKTEESRRFSDETDWMFLILLLLTSLTGFAVDIFVGLGMPLATYISFTVHLAVVVPLLAEVPFAKWSHLAYRPFGLYFSRVASVQTPKVTAIEQQTIQ